MENFCSVADFIKFFLSNDQILLYVEIVKGSVKEPNDTLRDDLLKKPVFQL